MNGDLLKIRRLPLPLEARESFDLSMHESDSSFYERRINFLPNESEITPKFSEDEIREQEIVKLLEKYGRGLPVQSLMKIIEVAQSKLKPSRMVLNADSSIVLTDYKKTIHLEPQKMVMYLFYVRHEKGVRYDELSDYTEEFLGIYSKLSSKEDYGDMKVSISALIRNKELITQTVSKIKGAFKGVIDEKLISPYIISGKQGKRKRISLDRELVSNYIV